MGKLFFEIPPAAAELKEKKKWRGGAVFLGVELFMTSPGNFNIFYCQQSGIVLNVSTAANLAGFSSLFPDFTAFFSRWGLVDVSKVCVKTGGKKCVKKAGQAMVDRVDKDIGK